MPRLTRTVALAAAAAVLVAVTLAAGPAAQAPAVAARRAITLDDLAKIKSVGDPQRSPDGKWVAYVVTSADLEKDKRDSDIWMVSWDGAQTVRLTSGPEKESAPRWSPDGRYLSFLSSRGTEEEKKKGAQIWLLDRLGGEAQKLTEIEGGVDEYSWSPDSKRFVFTKSDQDPADEPEKMEGWKRKTLPPIVLDRYRFKRDRDGYLKRLYSHVYVFDIAAKKAEQVTSGPFDDSEPSWSPDGTKIAFVSTRTGPDPDRHENSDIYVVDAKPGAEPRQVTTSTAADAGRPAWSPDGRWIAYFQGDETRYLAYEINKLAIVPAAGGAAKVLTAALDRPVGGPISWSPDSRMLTFTVEDDRASYVGRTSVAGGQVEKLTAGRRTVSDVSLGADGRLTLLAGTSTATPEVHALENGTLRQLTKVNDELFAQLQLATTEDFTSTSKDGTVVNGLIVKPASYAAGTKYPTLLIIHGGPNGQDDYSFTFENELYAANGYVVLNINYRGSSGRGEAFQKAIYADWGNKEVVDLLGAVDQAVASGVADPERLGIGGWSYGGLLTDYTIASDTRFKAAVSGAGSALQSSMYGVDHYIVQWDTEIGQPWKAQDLYLKVSYPFWHADRIKTPTLFLCGEKDFNVPLAGSEQMYQALRSLGVDTELVIYPEQFHGLTKPSYVRDRYERYLAWFDKYLKR
ncbi:MAG TPA: S9 family peptidase [Vicinamibacterales bacterium]|nr:S9 family peptidase [Vicinamibacterales bacterium]HOQ59368.1 S9 family peptidase [Vicinamibacterales bacterium]HPK71044.1 S9 family peptidase [Vicinamibacterales bacterium]